MLHASPQLRKAKLVDDTKDVFIHNLSLLSGMHLCFEIYPETVLCTDWVSPTGH